ncbi:MAG: glycoside hydrolase family 26 protein, partial [Acidimicrobiia bacterium]
MRNRSHRPTLMAAGLALLVMSATLPSPPADARAGRPAGPLVPVDGFYVGAYTKHPDGSGFQRQQEAVKDLEAELGRRLHIDHHFYDWEKPFPSEREPWDLANGRIPMISWNGPELSSGGTSAIIRGAHDGLIVTRADAVKALGEPVFLRWFWEMDGNKNADRVESAANYVKAWRHIHDLFTARGASNAVWVWCPNASAMGDGDARPYYPGPRYVDWVCGDGYNFHPNRPGDKWRGFDEIFGDFYRVAQSYHKPIMIGEFGVLEDPNVPGRKQAWFHQAHDAIRDRYPALAAVVYFNADSTTNGIYFNFRVGTSPESFEGFRYMFTGPPPIPGSFTRPETPAPVPPTTATTRPKAKPATPT